MPGTFRIFASVFAVSGLLAASVFAFSQHDKLAEARDRFESETDPVHRAKLTVRLEKAEFDYIEKEIADNNESAALDALHEYERDVASCVQALDARGVNAEKHSAGFKELEISVREALRRLNDVVISLPGDEQKPFLEVRDNLDQLNRHLMNELFPSRPDNADDSGKPKN